MIIAIDFDGTICEQVWPGIGKEPIPDAIDTIRWLHKQGHILILWTCREGESLKQALSVLEEFGIRECFSEINRNTPESIAEFSNDSRKIGAEIFIDDRSLGWSGWKAVQAYFGIVPDFVNGEWKYGH